MKFIIPVTKNVEIDMLALRNMERSQLVNLQQAIAKILAENAPGVPAEVASMPIKNLGLNVRIENCLKHHYIFTVGDLLSKNPTELLRIRNFGKKCMAELRMTLREKFGINW